MSTKTFNARAPGSYPLVRMRRLRKAAWIRDLRAETSLCPMDLILPIFVVEGQNISEPIETMPGVCRISIDQAVDTVHKAYKLGIKMVALFPVIASDLKTPQGSYAIDANNLICRAIRAIKQAVPDIGVMVDIALDPYTTHGHDGVLDPNQEVDNDQTIEMLIKQSLVCVQAGCDALAPSDMMDGRIMKIRTALEEAGFHNTIIISYAAKYASAFYGPFRNAVKSHRKDGEYLDKNTYQMDIRNIREMETEVQLDAEEGADMAIIKPGLPCLDVIGRVGGLTNMPILAYQVSGEYSMLRFGAQAGCFDYKQAMLESLIAFKRAGASAILTYAALEVASWLK